LSPIYFVPYPPYRLLAVQEGEDLKAKVDVFITLLYGNSKPDVAPGRRLSRLGEVLLATELMHLRQCHDEFPNHPRFSLLFDAAQRSNVCGVDQHATVIVGQLHRWGTAIKLQWRKENLIEQVKSANNLGEHDKQICELMAQLQQDAALKHQLSQEQAMLHKNEVLQV
jgi:hypothetical protein